MPANTWPYQSRRTSQSATAPTPGPAPQVWTFRPRRATASATSPVAPTLSFKEAIAAALKADATLTALIGQRVNPAKIHQLKTYPALSFRITSRIWDNDLDGPTGTVEATVEFIAYSRSYAQAEGIVIAARNIFDGYQGDLSGVAITYALASDDGDDYSPSDDASDSGTFTDSISITFGYRI